MDPKIILIFIFSVKLYPSPLKKPLKSIDGVVSRDRLLQRAKGNHQDRSRSHNPTVELSSQHDRFSETGTVQIRGQIVPTACTRSRGSLRNRPPRDLGPSADEYIT